MKPKTLTLLMITSAMVMSGWLFCLPNAVAGQQAGYVEKGKKLFLQHCATCHGTDGKGQGPVAAVLKDGPPDLTLIKAPNEKFPLDRVLTVIDGEKSVTAHGTRKMPVWGTVFRRTNGELRKQADIYCLARFVESIQGSK